MPAAQQWDLIVVPTYNTQEAIFEVAADPAYHYPLAIREVAITEVADAWVNTVEGSIIAFPATAA